ncbi:MAG: FAD-binding oxidoreductase [Thermoplasmata archaeon]|nr:MAG: FAD-binding oxidoreductase [Thermoplasmata archaeon]
MMSDVIKEIANAVGEENISWELADLYVYGGDASIHHSMPDVVVRPRGVEDVQVVIKIAYERNLPVTVRGSGTSLSGNAVPMRGGIVLDMKSMNRIKEINTRDMYAVVEPGVINDDLNAMLAEQGFFFPPTPASGKVATIGGMIGNNASGMRAGKYGATRDALLQVKVVLPNGDLATFGTKNLKNSSGYHLEKLFVGSEGTLGVIVEATIKIAPLPSKRGVILASYSSVYDAGRAVGDILHNRYLPSAIEIMDSVCIRAVNTAMGVGLPECDAILLVEVDGREESVQRDAMEIAEICRRNGAIDVKFTVDKNEMEKLWKGRRGVLPSLSRLEGGIVSTSLADDMNVPLSKIPEAIKRFQDVARKYGIIVGTYGHAGTGNLHTKVLFNPARKENWEKIRRAMAEIYGAVHELGGTTSGEHGIGISKAPFFVEEKRGTGTIEIMKIIKNALDRKGIMNPGKLCWAPEDFVMATRLRYPVDKNNFEEEMSNEEG